MSQAPGNVTGTGVLMAVDAGALRRNWGWFLVLGLAEVILGLVVLALPFIASLTAVSIFGVFLLIGGVLQGASAFWTRGWGSFFFDLLAGVLYVVVGLVVLREPINALQAITLLLGAFYLVGGFFRIVGALSVRFHNWGWMLLSGLVTLLLGVYIFALWPVDSLYVIGILIGIDLIFTGWFWVMLALAARGARTPV